SSKRSFVQVYNNVVNIDESISQPEPWTLILNGHGNNTCKTLGVRPINEVINLRQNSSYLTLMSQTFDQAPDFVNLNMSSSNFEMKATINISQNATAGFTFRRSSNGLKYATLIYDPVAEYLILNRTYSSLIKAFDHTIVYAKQALFTTLIHVNITQKELLSLHTFLDNSLLEIYANNRTLMATHIIISWIFRFCWHWIHYRWAWWICYI
ncbi:unnamed protein product, partial [Rotaria magnacalcarata]